MALPRFQLLPAARVQSRQAADGVSPPARDPDGAVLWRLLGANNYELGRSATPYPSAGAAHMAIRELARDAAELEPELDPEAPGGWRWRLLRDGAAVAASSRAFAREREARDNLAQFVDHVADTVMVPTPRAAETVSLPSHEVVTP